MSTGSVGRTFIKAVRSPAAPPAWSFATLPVSSRRHALVTVMPFASYRCSHHARSYSSRPSSPPATTGPPRKKRTILDLLAFKRRQVPITMLTAYDFPSARFIEHAFPSSSSHPNGVDVCLVGDSLAMVACGYPSTISLTLDEMLYHCRSVSRGCISSLLVADMPFGSYTSSLSQAVTNASRLVQEGNMDAVKLEGGSEILDVVTRLTEIGIPVMGHVGLTPQRQAALSGYRVQGKTLESALAIYHDALALQAAGAFSIVLEAVPSKLASFISTRLEIPTIGIGAGKGCDGQVLVQLDMLGVASMEKGPPRFVKLYAEAEKTAREAVGRYVSEVREGTFPEERHGYEGMGDEMWEAFVKVVEAEPSA